MKLIQDECTKAQELKEEIYYTLRNTDFLKNVGCIYNTIGLFNSTRVLGNCHRSKGSNIFKISLNRLLVERGTDEQIKATILHELIHTMPNCFNHQRQFKNMCNKYYSLANIKNSKEFDNVLIRKARVNYKYKIVCENCGQVLGYRDRLTKVVKHYDLYRCKACHGKIKVVNNS